MLLFHLFVDEYIKDSYYAKSFTTDGVECPSIKHIVKRLEFLLNVVDKNKHEEYYNSISEVYSVYKRDINSKEDVECMEKDLLPLKYNMFETYEDAYENKFKASKVLQELYNAM